MAVELSFKSALSLGFLSLFVYWFYQVLEWVWLKPKRYEKILRAQGFKGNPYRLLTGDQQESEELIREAYSKPIGFEEDLCKRLIPHSRKIVQTYGSNSFTWVGRIPRVHITDPDLVREVLTKYYQFHKNLHDHDPITRILLTGVGMLEGKPWAARRKIIKSAFFFEKLKSLLPAFYVSTIEMINKWDKIIPEGGSAEIEVWEHMRVLSGDHTARTLFGEEFMQLGGVIYDLLQELNLLTVEVIRSVYIPGWRFLPTKRNNRMRAIDREIRDRVVEIIHKKKEHIVSGEHTGTDFLRTLIECNLNEIKEYGKNVEMTLEEMVKECKLFFLAGQDTTASLVTWSLIFLCRFPEWQTRAREEVLQIVGPDKKPDYDAISHLKTLSMILYETLRLYPPIVELTKVAQEDTQLGPYFIPAGTHLMMPQLMLHYDPKYWGEDVLEFKPERFKDGVVNATKMQGAYFPFSLGPRMCMGQNFSLMESKMTLSLLLRRYSFELSPKYVHSPFQSFTMQPQHGAEMIVSRLKK